MSAIATNAPSKVGAIQSGTVRSRGPTATLMPPPAPMDAYSVMFLLTSQSKSQSTESAKLGSITQREEQKADIEKVDAELKAQREAEENKSFWDDLGDVFSVVGIALSAVASVASFGALSVAAVALSVAVLVENKTHFLEEAGVDPGVAMALTIGCAVGSAAAGGVSGFLENGKDLLGMGAKLKAAAEIADGAVKGATAVPKAAVAVCTNDAGIAEVRAEEASAKLEHSERVTDGIVKTYKNVAKSYDSALKTLVSIVSERSQIAEAISRGIA